MFLFVYESIRLTELYPLTGIIGQQNKVFIKAENFYPQIPLYCRFIFGSSTLVVKSETDSSCIFCTLLPSYTKSFKNSIGSVSVSSDQKAWVFEQSFKLLALESRGNSLSYSPESASVSGGTWIQIQLKHSLDALVYQGEPLYCNFNLETQEYSTSIALF